MKGKTKEKFVPKSKERKTAELPEHQQIFLGTQTQAD